MFNAMTSMWAILLGILAFVPAEGASELALPSQQQTQTVTVPVAPSTASPRS